MLRDMVVTSLDAQQIGELLTMAGFELEELVGAGDQAVLDIKVMANRGDGLSALGLAREILAKDIGGRPTELYRRAVARFQANSEPMSGAELHGVGLEIRTDACSRYACKLFKARIGAQTPEWIKVRLTAAGMRPIGLIVDLTNYVLLELGQPMHAFDLEKLRGPKIIVRQAEPGERLQALTGQDLELDPAHMVICDAERPIALAGVVGGADTEVSDTTGQILLESAHFANDSVRKTRKALGISTEASYRFERWVDPDGVVAAIKRFEELFEQASGGDALPGILDQVRWRPTPRQISFSAARASALLGMEVTEDQSRLYLQKLGFEAGPGGGVSPPSWRPDVVREEDVVEEVGRVHGYDMIPEALPFGASTLGGAFGIYGFIDRVREVVVRLGFTQIISHSLRDAHPLDFPENGRVEVRNPHSPDASLLRNSLLPNLADAARRNAGRELSLFEIGKVFIRGEVQIDESPELGMWSAGPLFPPHWSGQAPAEADFFSMKGVLEALCSELQVEARFARPLNADPRLHSTRQASLLVNERIHCGIFGQIHPAVAEDIGAPVDSVLAELDLLVLYAGVGESSGLRQISRNPAVRRDLAVLIDKTVPYEQVQSTVTSAAGPLLERMWLFDVYEGKGISEGQHSLGIALALRKMGENLTDEEANAARDQVASALQAIGGRLR